jgi:superoxide dismutase
MKDRMKATQQRNQSDSQGDNWLWLFVKSSVIAITIVYAEDVVYMHQVKRNNFLIISHWGH